MELSMIFHPSEWRRFWRLWAKEIERDLELRFPETRRRFAFEIRQVLGEEEQARYQNVIRRFHSAKREVSALDWPLLVEWNERKQQALSVAMIEDHLHRHTNSIPEKSELLESIRARLIEIKELTVEANLPRDPSLWRCLQTRARQLPLREEAEYLCQRLSFHHFDENSPSLAS